MASSYFSLMAMAAVKLAIASSGLLCSA